MTNKTMAAAQVMLRATAVTEGALSAAIAVAQDAISSWDDTDDLDERKARHALVHALNSAKSGHARLKTALAYTEPIVNGGEYREPFAGREREA